LRHGKKGKGLGVARGWTGKTQQRFWSGMGSGHRREISKNFLDQGKKEKGSEKKKGEKTENIGRNTAENGKKNLRSKCGKRTGFEGRGISEVGTRLT